MKYGPEIENFLVGNQSKQQTNNIIDFVGNEPMKMKALMAYFFHKEWRFNQWASWPLGFIGRNHPELLKPYHSMMIEALKNPSHDAVARNILRVYEYIEIPDNIEGELFELGFGFLIDPKYPIAFRCFSMTVCYKISLKYPELQDELVAEIETHLPHGSPGFKSRGKKILKLLQQRQAVAKRKK